MWLGGAAEPAGQDAQTAIILGILTLLGLVLVALVTGLFQWLAARAARTNQPPASGHELYERLAILEHRVDDHDDVREIVDRRLDQHERALDIDNPEWRHDGH